MARSPTQPVPPPSSPVPTGWDEYLGELGLTRTEQQELDSGKLSLNAFVDRKAQKEARVNAAFYRNAEVNGDTDVNIFIHYVIEAIDQLSWHEDKRYRHIPNIPGVLEASLIRWAEERYDEIYAKQKEIWQQQEEEYRRNKEELQMRLSTIPEDEEYEPED
jgi:hypothetical protein